MLKLISIKDPHFSIGFQNRIRLDYQKDIMTKLNFIQKYCKDNKINGIIFTGDITDSNYDRKWSFRQYVKNKRAFEFLKINEDFKLFSPMGNHDMFHGLEESSDTVFDELVKENIIHNITTNPFVFDNKSNKKVKIYGINYSNNKENIYDALNVINNDSFINTEYFKIVVMHNNLTPDEERLTEYTYEELKTKFQNINMFIAGHYHIGYDTQRLGNTWFINNWNLTRVVRDYDVSLDQHTPEFEEIIFNDEGELQSLKTIKIPFSKFEETFIPNAINIIKKSKQEIFEFFQIDFNDMISKQTDEEIIDQFEYDPIIKELALKYLNGD